METENIAVVGGKRAWREHQRVKLKRRILRLWEREQATREVRQTRDIQTQRVADGDVGRETKTEKERRDRHDRRDGESDGDTRSYKQTGELRRTSNREVQN